ncbi:MAG: hypothetical protein GY768_10150 [Planctomycetaceae bacterium]|nr:hypothetical protein [Planctomycetaceae bacterium]
MLFPQTKRAVLLAACAVIVANFGCKPADSGSGNTTTAQASAPQSDSTVAASVDLSATPDLAVSSFLDALKNGDESLATSMLTQVAQAEMQRTQAAIKPPGSPTAKFDVDEVEYLGEQQTGAHVLSTWTDTDESGQEQTYEIVWILRKEDSGWAIAGMATRVFDDQDPLILNFEDPLDAQQKRNAVDAEIARRNEPSQIRQAQRPTLQR